ncbi:MAG: hypothetical protein II670_09960 [Alphaproteobacteria bacterium]|nr:hypothetical protein [Alphaproteobacteria bacterium]
MRTIIIAAMQKQRVDISNGIGFQSTNCFESYRRMLTPDTWAPKADILTFWTMQEKYTEM